MSNIDAIIVEDDLMSINILKSQLRTNFKDIKVSGIASNIKDSINLYKKLKPKILFLDIGLGKDNGFSLLDNIEIDDIKTQIVVTTSSNEFALKAIKYNAVDYLLKPLLTQDLIRAVKKAVFNINTYSILKSVQDSHENRLTKVIAIPYMDKIELIKTENIIFCEADGRYTKFHLINGDVKIASRNLGEYENLLDSSLFFRVHHSFLVNILMVHHINKLDGSYCQLINQKILPIAKRRQGSLNSFLNLK